MQFDGINSWFAKFIVKIGIILQIFGIANVDDLLAAFYGALEGTTETTEEETTEG